MTETLMRTAARRVVPETPAQAAHLRGWRWEMRLRTTRITRAVSGSVVYAEDGAASLEVETDVDLDGSDRSPVQILCGYRGEPQRLYFEGTVDRAIKNPYTGTTMLTAYGVMGAMGRQYFDTKRDFTNYSIPSFFRVVEDLLHDYRAVISVRPTSEIILEQADFGGETSLREAADRIVEPVDYLLRDRPDFDLYVGPKLQPAVGGASTFVYAPSNYQHGQLQIDPATDLYAKVVAFRREDLEFTTGSGENAETETRTVEVVRAEAEVVNPGPNLPRKNEIYWIPDFPGSQATAERVVRITADALGIGAFKGSLGGVYANARIITDTAGQIRRIEDDEIVTYACRATDTKLDLVAGLMDFSFDALKQASVARRVSDRDIRQKAAFAPRISQHVLFTRIPAVGRDAENRLYMEVRNDGPDWFGYDADGRFFIDPEREEQGVSGRNPDGSFFVDPEAYIE